MKQFYNNNLDSTGGKYNNPYTLIQKAGKTIKSKKSRRSKKSKKNKKRRKNKINY